MVGRVRGQFLAHAEHRDSLRKPRKAGTLLFAVLAAPPTQRTFLAGYGVAQALPGLLFAFSAFLGTVIAPGGIIGAILALVAIYLPAGLALFGTLPQWDRLRSFPQARVLLAGANATVVGLLGAAFYSPIWTSTITEPKRLALMLPAYAALQFWRMLPWFIVGSCAAFGGYFLGWFQG